MIYLVLFLCGGALYVCLEFFWRGRSHASMAIAGGTVLALFYGVFTRWAYQSMLLRSILGAVLITAVEFIVGAIVNVRMGLCVWDYSRFKWNLYGQICLPYSLLWIVVSAPALAIVDFIYSLQLS